jgi:hypothetical protein
MTIFSRRWRTHLGTGAVAAMVGSLLSALPIAPAAADPVAHASLIWGLTGTSQGAAHAGGCDYFIAGTSDGTAAGYKTVDGNVYIVKQSSGGTLSPVTERNRCSVSDGTSIGQRMYFSGGVGQREADGSAQIAWTGSATVNAYGGLVPWFIKDPVLRVDADGNGTVKATVGGFASSMANPEVKEPLDPRPDVTIATIAGADVSDPASLRVTPVYSGVDYFPLQGDGTRANSSVISPSMKDSDPGWGSWPEPFVDFQYATGLSTYWHTSGGSADAKKPPMPLTVTYDSSVPDFAGEAPTLVKPPAHIQAVPGEDVELSVEASGTDLRYQWQKRDSSFEYVDIDGATGKTLSLSDVTGTDASMYQVVVSNGLGTVQSSPVEVRVEDAAPPVLDVDPSDLWIAEGGSGSFSGGAGGYPDPTYQWQSSPDGKSWSDVGDAQGTQGHPVSKADLDDDGRQFRFVASNGHGEPVTSAAAELRVAPLDGPGLAVVPGTRIDPSVDNTLTVLGGQLPATSPGHIVVGVADAATWNPTSPALGDLKASGIIGQPVYNGRGTGSFDTRLSIGADTLEPAKDYLLVSFTFPTASKDFATTTPLTFGSSTPLKVTTQPTNLTAQVGSNIALTAAVSGDPAPTHLRWQRLTAAGWRYVPGARSNVLTMSSVQSGDAGQYRLVATRGSDQVRSDPAWLTVSDRPETVQPGSRPTIAGRPVVGTKVTARPGHSPAGVQLSYQWRAGGVAIPGAKQATLVVPKSARNKSLTVAVTATSNGSVSTSISRPTVRVAVKGTVRIRGVARVGRSLRAVSHGWTPRSTKRFVWRIGTKQITTSRPTLKLRSSFRGKRISVTVVARKPHHATVTGVSRMVRIRR